MCFLVWAENNPRNPALVVFLAAGWGFYCPDLHWDSLGQAGLWQGVPIASDVSAWLNFNLGVILHQKLWSFLIQAKTDVPEDVMHNQCEQSPILAVLSIPPSEDALLALESMKQHLSWCSSQLQGLKLTLCFNGASPKWK